MKRVYSGVAIVAGLVLLGSTGALAQPAGCVGGSKDAEKCESGIAKSLGKFVASVIKCHIKQADAAFKGTPTADEDCEENGPKSAKGKLDSKIAKYAPTCPANVLANAAALEAGLLSGPTSLDVQNLDVYCDSTSGVLIDGTGDDLGFVPATKDNLKCADSVAKALGKITGALVKCTYKYFDKTFVGGTFDYTGCQNGALGKYDANASKLQGLSICPGCLSPPSQLLLRVNVQSQVNAASPLLFVCPGTTTSTTVTTSTSSTVSTSTSTSSSSTSTSTSTSSTVSTSTSSTVSTSTSTSSSSTSTSTSTSSTVSTSTSSTVSTSTSSTVSTSTSTSSTTSTSLPGSFTKLRLAIKPGTTSCGGAGLYPHCKSGNIIGGTNGLGACAVNADCGTTGTPRCIVATPPAAPFSGQLNNAAATKLADIGSGCLYFGGGGGINVPGGKIPTSIFTDFSITGTGTLTIGAASGPATSCSLGGGPGFQCFDNAHVGLPCAGLDPDPACGNVTRSCNKVPNCYFGPPLPIENPTNHTTNTCVVNVIDSNPSGSANTGTGVTTINLSLRSHVYTTSTTFGATTPCPQCLAGVCNGGARAGLACTVGSPSTNTSIDCMPNTNQWSAPLGVNLTPLSTGTTNLASTPSGVFCPGQPDIGNNQGALGVALARNIVLTGSAAAGGLSGSPHAAVVASPFCLGSVNGVIDAAGNLPGPGALSLVTDITLLP